MRLLKATLACLALLCGTERAAGQAAEIVAPAAPVPIVRATAPNLTSNATDLPPGMNPAVPPNAPSMYGIDPACLSLSGPRFIVSADAIVLSLLQSRTVPLVLDNVNGATLLTNKSADLGLQAGPRIVSTYLTDEGGGFQLDYFGVYNWSGDAAVTSPGRLGLPDVLGAAGSTVDYSAADTMRLRAAAEVNNLNVNFVFAQPQAAVSFLVGGRFLRLTEELDLDTYNGARFSSYEVATRNELYGIHLGGHWQAVTGCVKWEAQALAGVCDNNVRQTTFVTDNNRNVVLRNFAPQQSLASFVGEATLGGSYCVNRTWTLRAGYDVLVATNMARPAEQFDFSNNSTSGNRLFFRTALMHGFHAGVEARW